MLTDYSFLNIIGKDIVSIIKKLSGFERLDDSEIPVLKEFFYFFGEDDNDFFKSIEKEQKKFIQFIVESENKGINYGK